MVSPPLSATDKNETPPISFRPLEQRHTRQQTDTPQNAILPESASVRGGFKGDINGYSSQNTPFTTVNLKAERFRRGSLGSLKEDPVQIRVVQKHKQIGRPFDRLGGRSIVQKVDLGASRTPGNTNLECSWISILFHCKIYAGGCVKNIEGPTWSESPNADQEVDLKRL
ncbi:hypothetical protein EV401DRAFT_1884999 [Pisolithus croceorrhizus]|nr:hypothetical protein EV401DRAFT_1884999 [Pisolithus croceorrhizus]